MKPFIFDTNWVLLNTLMACNYFALSYIIYRLWVSRKGQPIANTPVFTLLCQFFLLSGLLYVVRFVQVNYILILLIGYVLVVYTCVVTFKLYQAFIELVKLPTLLSLQRTIDSLKNNLNETASLNMELMFRDRVFDTTIRKLHEVLTSNEDKDKDIQSIINMLEKTLRAINQPE